MQARSLCTGQAFSGHITHFDAMGVPHGGCGISMERSVDDNGKKLPFLALNTNSLFENGANCGRWVEITLEENCDGGGNGQWSICQGGSTHLIHSTFYACSLCMLFDHACSPLMLNSC